MSSNPANSGNARTRRARRLGRTNVPAIPIVAQTIYTLHCTILPGAVNFDGSPAVWTDQTATVNVVPKFKEQ